MIDHDNTMRKLCIQQGYVPSGCLMDGFFIMGFVNGGDDPCIGCNEIRSKCGGRPTKLFPKEKPRTLLRYFPRVNNNPNKRRRGLPQEWKE